ncbi:unnamed protein product [Phytomonas sp. EM1]|nr:unnamed protein product [Phytomonas sp. EM1]|eukprot:CCW60239.1 unnamed protein product [Phytomonas sp. isolate EM1]
MSSLSSFLTPRLRNYSQYHCFQWFNGEVMSDDGASPWDHNTGAGWYWASRRKGCRSLSLNATPYVIHAFTCKSLVVTNKV